MKLKDIISFAEKIKEKYPQITDIGELDVGYFDGEFYSESFLDKIYFSSETIFKDGKKVEDFKLVMDV